MLSPRSFAAAIIIAALPIFTFAQAPGGTSADPYFVHHKQVSIDQGEDKEYGRTLAMDGDVIVAGDLTETVEVLRKNPDGSWSLEATISTPTAGISFGTHESIATNGDWIAIGAKVDDTFGNNSGAVHMYKFNGTAWDYRGALSHMAPYGSIITDQFGMALAMDGDRMVVGSRAENGVGAAGAVHYFTYNAMLDMWVESGFIASEHTSGGSTSKFAESVDISGDYMIVGEYRNSTNGSFAGAAHIYSFHNQCWHLQDVFYGHAADDLLGSDVAISGTNAVAGSPASDIGGSNAGAVTLYQLVPFSGDESFWAETFHFAPDAAMAGDRFGEAVDLDEELLAVGAPRDDEVVTNGGLGYFLFDCSTDNLDCVAEGTACDAQQNDRFGYDVAVSSGLAAIGAMLDDNIFEDAGSVYVLGADDIGFACDVTGPAAPMVDLVDANDTGADNADDLTRHTTPDFDLFLPGGDMAAITSSAVAQAGDLLTWYLEDPLETETQFLTEDDITNGVVTMEFVYPGPVLPDGEYTFCSFITDIYGNIGETGCLTVIIDNVDPEPAFEGGAEYDVSNTDTYGAYLPGASDPADCEALAAASGGNWVGVINDAETNMVAAGCYITGGNPFQASDYEWQAYATLLPDTTLYLDMMGDASLDLLTANNISATDNIAMDTLFADMTAFDCEDVGLNAITLTAIDMAGNIAYSTFQVEVVDNLNPEPLTQDVTVELDASGAGSITTSDIDNGSNDACGIDNLSLDQTDFNCSHVGTNTVTLTVTDNNGNDSTATAIVTVEDNIDPEALAQGMTLELDVNGAGSITADQIDDGSNDACGIDTMTISQSDFDCSHVGLNIVTLMVTDNNGNSSTATATVIVQDNVSPEALTQNITLELDASGSASITPSQIDNGSNDACGLEGATSASAVAISASDLFAPANANWPHKITMTTAADPTSNAQQTLEINVTSLPTGGANYRKVKTVANGGWNNGNPQALSLGQNIITVSAVGFARTVLIQFSESDIEFDALTVNGNQLYGGGNPDAGLALSQTDFDCSHVGLNTVTLTVTDVNGNISTETATVTVEDNVDPVALTQDLTVQLDENGEASISASQINNGSNDACGIEGASVSPAQVAYSALMAAGSNANWPFVYTATTSSDPSSGNQQTMVVNVTSLPSGGANYRVFKTSANGSSVFGNSQALSLGQNTINVAGVAFNRSVKLQFSNGDIEFDGLVLNGEEQFVSSEALSSSDIMSAGSNANWPQVFTATTSSDPASGNQQTMVVNVTSLPSGGANYRVFKTSANGSSVFGSPQALSLGQNTVSVASVGFTRAVKLQFSDGDVEVDSFVLNGEEQISSAPGEVSGIVLDQTDFDCSHVGTNTVNLTVTDVNGNSSSETATVTVQDNVNPTVVTQNITLELDASGMGSITAAQIDNGSSDACDIDTMIVSQSDFDCSHVGSNTVNLTVTDVNGNSSSETATVTVQDNVNPTVVTQNITLELDASGLGSITAAQIDNGSSDACDIDTMIVSQSDFDCSHVGSNTVSLTVTDVNGNSSSETATVTVEDNVNPTVVTQNITLELDASGMGSITAAQIDNGSSDACDIDTMIVSQSDFDCSHVGSNTVNLTVTDVNGNSSSETATVTVQDNVNPTVVTQNITLELDASGLGSITAAQIDNGSSDACDIDTMIVSQSDFDCSHVGSNTVNLTVTDVNGNSSSETATVTVQDNVNPTVVTQNITLELDASGLGSITAAQIDNGSSDACDIDTMIVSQTDFDCNHIGSNTVSLTVTDVNGNSSSETATVTVEDNVIPTALTEDLTLELDASGLGSITVDQIDNGSSDACGVDTVFLSQSDFDCSHVGSNTVSLTVTDVNGNSSNETATITVQDNVNPTVVTQNITLELDASGLGSITAAQIDNGSSDACDIDTMIVSQTDFDCSHIGSNTVNLTVTDVNGNSSSETATVTVQDNVNPTVVTQNITLELDASGLGSITAAQIDNGSSDACDIDTMIVSQSDFDCSHVGSNTVNLTVTDVNGNSSSETATVTVQDNVNPTVVTQNITLELDASGLGSITAAQIDNGSSDACDIDTMIVSQSDFDCSHVGSNTVSLTVTDVNGNSSSETATVTVQDNVNPTVVTQNITLELDASGLGSITAAQIDNGSSDACDIDTMIVSQSDFDCSHVGSNTVNLTVTDVNGNSSSETATVTVEDKVNPTAIAQDLTVYLDASGMGSITAAQIDNGSSDACDIDTLIISQSDFDCSHLGDNSVTLTAIDNNANSGMDLSTVTVLDTLIPTVTLVCPENYTVDADGMCYADLSPAAAGDPENPTGEYGAAAQDNCDGAPSIAYSHVDADTTSICEGAYSFTRTWTAIATDGSGNESLPATCEQVITVNDNTSPSVVTAASDVTYQRDGNEASEFSTWLSDQADAVANDNCSDVTWNHNSSGLSDECGSTGTETVTFTASDDCGNTATTTATFTVIDYVAPSCPLIDLTDDSDNGLSGTDNTTNDTTPTMRVRFTGSGHESAEAGDIVELFIAGELSETHTVTSEDVANGYAEFETGPFADGGVQFSALHIDDCGQSSIFAFLNIIVHTTDPSVSLQDVTVYLDENGSAVIAGSEFDNGSFDDFGALSFQIDLDESAFLFDPENDSTSVMTIYDVETNQHVFVNLDSTISSSSITSGWDVTDVIYDENLGGFVFFNYYGDYVILDTSWELIEEGSTQDWIVDSDVDIEFRSIAAMTTIGDVHYALKDPNGDEEDLQFFSFTFAADNGTYTVSIDLIANIPLYACPENLDNRHYFNGLAVDTAGPVAYFSSGALPCEIQGDSSNELWKMDMNSGQMEHVGRPSEWVRGMWFDEGELYGFSDGEIWTIPTSAGPWELNDLDVETHQGCEALNCDQSEVVTFTISDGADMTDPANWDVINDVVAISRRCGDEGPNNPKVQPLWNGDGPQGTYWKPGPTAEKGAFTIWDDAIDDNPLSPIIWSLWVPSSDQFFDVEIHDWAWGDDGCAFSYTRTQVDRPTSYLPAATHRVPQFLGCDSLNCDQSPEVTFTKLDFTDVTDPSNWDVISDDVALTRGSSRTFFNARSESSFNTMDYSSPVGTFWAVGLTASQEGQTYRALDDVESFYYDSLYTPDTLSLHLPSTGQFFDVIVHDYTCEEWFDDCENAGGGGFSYTRTLVDGPAEYDIDVQTNYTTILPLTEVTEFETGYVNDWVNFSAVSFGGVLSNLLYATCADVGEPFEVEVLVGDVAGNTVPGTAMLTVLDTVSPVLTLPEVFIVELDESGIATLEADAILGDQSMDACGVGVTLSPASFGCEDAGEFVPTTVTVEDPSGNSTTRSFLVLVRDAEDPVASGQDVVLYLDENGQAELTADMLENGSTDNCSVTTLELIDPDSVPANLDQWTRYPLNTGTYDEETSECDDCTSQVPLGFNFSLYGDAYDSLWISSNGLISFLSSDYNCCEGELLDDEEYDASIAVIHTDIDPDECEDCGIYYATMGEAPNREFVVSWQYVSNYEDNYYRHDAQLVLYEGSNQFEIYHGGLPTYLPDDCDDPMTTGVSNPGGTEGTGPYEQICGPVSQANFRFTPNADGGYDWIEFNPFISGVASMMFDCDQMGSNEVTLLVRDAVNNQDGETVTVEVVDEIFPVVNIFDLEDHTLYAGESCVNTVDLFAAGQPWYEATDNCDLDVEIFYDEINETGIAGCREFDRRWIIEATDGSGNMTSDTTLQHITVVDTTAPVVFLAGVPADVSFDLDADCNGDLPAAAAVTASATDNCSDAPSVGVVTYVDSAPAYLCGDAGSYTVLRTYMASATDNCGNAGMASATQTVTFLDVTAPQITFSNDISNGEEIAQSQENSVFSWINLANPVNLVSADACGGEVTAVQTTSMEGLLPTDDIGNYCEGLTPEAFMDGEACNGDDPQAMILEGAYFDGEGFTVVDGGINLIEGHYDQTLFIQVEMENADGTGGFIWSADYNAAQSWPEWSSLGRGYKKDCSDVMPGMSPWTDWQYLIMQTGGMIGTGIFAGTELSLTHQPMNYYYGLQVGNGANNQNDHYGASAWFYWSGQLVVNGVSQGFMGSSGDIMLDMDCTLPWTVDYDYVLTDACGNSTEFGYTIAGEDDYALSPATAVGEGHTPFDISVSGDLKEPIRVTGLQPNPTSNVSQLGFVVSNNMRLRVDLFSMSGELVQELYDGNAMSDVEYLMTIDADGLDAGMYQIRIASNSYMTVKKLLVTE